MTLKGNLEGGTLTLMTNVVSLFSVFRPLSSVAMKGANTEINRGKERERERKRAKIK